MDAYGPEVQQEVVNHEPLPFVVGSWQEGPLADGATDAEENAGHGSNPAPSNIRREVGMNVR
jgi:hypothetical protein